MLSWIILILWFVAGFLVLISKKRISRFEYGLIWVVLIIQLIDNIIQK